MSQGRALRAKGAPLKPYWWETYRGGCSLNVTNREAFIEAVDGYQLVMGLVQRLPYAQRAQAIADGRLVLFLGGVPEHKIDFRVVRWQKETATLTLHFVSMEASVVQYEFWYIGSWGPSP